MQIEIDGVLASLVSSGRIGAFSLSMRSVRKEIVTMRPFIIAILVLANVLLFYPINH